MRIEIEDDGSYHEILSTGERKKLEPTKITLTDCLACSGCVTTAETVLIQEQGLSEFYKNLNTGKIIVVTLSQQSTASVAAHHKLNFTETFEKLTTMLLRLGVHHVFDISFARQISLLESSKEFINRKNKSLKGGDSSNGCLPLPMIISACPGWVCYAEKTQSDYVLPYMSSTKSPQQIMGTLIKNYFSQEISVEVGKLYHVCVMPCFDKKLEASRSDFATNGIRDVDLVLSSRELLEMITTFENGPPSRSPSFPLPPSKHNSNNNSSGGDNFGNGDNSENRNNSDNEPNHIPQDVQDESRKTIIFSNLPGTNSLSHLSQPSRPCGIEGRSSGGFSDYVFRKAAQEIFGVSITQITYTKGRNQDRVDAELKVDGKVRLRFGLVYGFRNIQNVMRTIKNQKCNYDLIEIMACPGGCTNGGGQIQYEDSTSSRLLLDDVERIFHQTPIQLPEENKEIKNLYSLGVETKELRNEFHTQYHRIPKLEISQPLTINW
eukprot:TRINITY_DN5831_c0_g1_i1.p1 TRINITY_DN5831_c0_g1~~TRINITY_DN5831_c0_g1_i1.p1  ORF type:complete len:492 (-),score=84.40 TRINITY_DN5831_c0_g1_i1:257-1732(-)